MLDQSGVAVLSYDSKSFENGSGAYPDLMDAQSGCVHRKERVKI